MLKTFWKEGGLFLSKIEGELRRGQGSVGISKTKVNSPGGSVQPSAKRRGLKDGSVTFLH